MTSGELRDSRVSARFALIVALVPACSASEQKRDPARIRDVLVGHCYGGPEGLGRPLGAFHANTGDATNLVIGEDGVFSSSINGCDFSYGAAGRWEADGDAIVLLPPEGSCSMSIAGLSSGGYADEVTCARVTQGADGNLTLSARSRGEPIEAVMLPGGVCATCGGGLGPSGPPTPCGVQLQPPGPPPAVTDPGYCDFAAPPKVDIRDPASGLVGYWDPAGRFTLPLMATRNFASVPRYDIATALVPVVATVEIRSVTGVLLLSGLDTWVDDPRAPGEFALLSQNQDGFNIYIWAGGDAARGPGVPSAGEYRVHVEVSDNPFVNDVLLDNVPLVLQ